MKLDNKKLYQATLGFSIRRFFWDVLAFIIVIAAAALGFFVAENVSNSGLIGLAIGAIVGIIIIVIMLRYVSYSLKAGQIAMMTQGITEDKLPDDVIGTGKQVVKSRFTTVAAYFAATSVIKGIFEQVGQAITAVGKAIGGDSGSAVGSTISSVIQTVVAYLCDCCLGWVFYRKDEKATKATLEGAAIFFKHGKTLAKNLGRVFGIGLLSLLVIGGIFGGIAYLIMSLFPDAFSTLSTTLVESAANSSTTLPEFLSNPSTLMIICAVIVGIIFWSILHSVFVRPFVLVGVLRNFINSGIDDAPSEKSFAELDKKSKKFAELHAKVNAEG